MNVSGHTPSGDDFTLGNLEPREEPLNEFVLRSFIAPSIAWLLGGQHSGAAFDRSLQKAPIRPQQNGSHWETAWCISYMLDSWDVLSSSQAYAHLCQDIRDRFNSDNRDSNPAMWLCTEALEQHGGTAHWPGKEYDTAVVSMALVRLLRQKHIEISPKIRSLIKSRCIQSQRWLRFYAFQSPQNCIANHESPAVLESILKGFALSIDVRQQLTLESGSVDENNFWICVDHWLSLLERKIGLTAPSQDGTSNGATADAPVEAAIGIDAIRCLCSVTETLIPLESTESNGGRLMRCRRILAKYVKHLETDLRVSRWGENLNRTAKLGLYVRAYRCAAGSDSAPHTEVVLGALSLITIVFFKNGSIFHNTYPTIYFLGASIELLKWQKATCKLSTLFTESLDVFVDGLLPGRLHSIELLNETITLRHELKSKEYFALELSKSFERYRMKTWWWVANVTTLVVAIVVYLTDSPCLANGSDRLVLVSVLAAIVLGVPMITHAQFKKD